MERKKGEEKINEKWNDEVCRPSISW